MHFHTFDGQSFDYQREACLTIGRSTTSASQLSLQIDSRPWPHNPDTTVAERAAFAFPDTSQPYGVILDIAEPHLSVTGQGDTYWGVEGNLDGLARVTFKQPAGPRWDNCLFDAHVGGPTMAFTEGMAYAREQAIDVGTVEAIHPPLRSAQPAVAPDEALGSHSSPPPIVGPPKPAEPAKVTGARGFDFEVGSWRVHHRTRKRLPDGGAEWIEFDGTSANHPIMGGLANVEENVFFTASGVRRGVTLRSFDRKTGQWAIWWLDERYPLGPVGPPVIGRFENGTGTFYSDDLVDGKPIRTRYIWGHITATSARWEQATSSDSGKSWETNWIMEFQRAQ